MSDTARVARAIQRIRAIEAAIGPHRPTIQEWQAYKDAAAELVDEAKDALHLTDDDIAQYEETL